MAQLEKRKSSRFGLLKNSETIPMVLFVSKHLKLNYWRVSDFQKITNHIKTMQN
jgi:hypothetical protein